MKTPKTSKTPDSYFVSLDGKQVGPYTLEELRKMWASKAVTAQTLYWQRGMPGWRPLWKLQNDINKAAPTEKEQIKVSLLDREFVYRLSIIGIPILLLLTAVVYLVKIESSSISVSNSLAADSGTSPNHQGIDTYPFDVKIDKWTVDEVKGISEIDGRITNVSNKTYEYAILRLDLRDAAGAYVGSTLGGVDNVAANSTSPFTIVMKQSTATSARIREVLSR